MTASESALSDKNVVMSLAKGFRVLEAFSDGNAAMTMAEVARRAGVDNATAFRFLNTLVMLGYVKKSDAKHFRLTLKCLDLGFHAIARMDLRDLARPLLRTLVNEEIEAASVAVLDGAEIVYIERVQAGLARLGIDVRIGSRAPAYSTAVGQAIMAWLPGPTQRAMLTAAPLRQLTIHTITSVPKLLARLKSVRERGYAISDQENVSGLRVLAAPVLDRDGLPAAAVSVATPASNQSVEAFERAVRDPVMDAARTLSKALQASGSVGAASQTTT